MIMKKTVGLVALALALGAGTASAAPNAEKFGLGYQGVFAGNFLQGVSGRYWFSDTIAGEVNLFYGTVGVNDVTPGGDHLGDADALLGAVKVMYAPVVKANSRFYVGLEGGLGSVGLNVFGDEVLPNSSVWTVEPLFGAEFFLSEIPELGFNFEVGYKFHHLNFNDSVDLNIDGTTVAVGAHYYF
ncbi:MAG: hypothetical protein WCI01_03395 [Chlorobiaceae bacterium]